MRSFLIILTAAGFAVPVSALAQQRAERGYSEEQGEQAVRTCREAVRQQAADRFGAQSVEFREARIDPDGDRVVGMIEVPRGDHEDHLHFACSMDFDRDEVRSVRIIPMEEEADNGYRERANGVDRAIDNCRSAVADRIAGQGYGPVQFDSTRIDEPDSRVFGTAYARRGAYSEEFDFACTVELHDGDLRSVHITRR